MELKLCHLYPDALNLYGDRGNILCMTQRLRWRGIDVAVTEKPIGSEAGLSGYDLIFIGGGQDFEQQILLEDLARGRAAELRSAVEDGVTILAVCGGYQMLGRYYRTADGQQFDFIGALDLETVGGEKRMIGNLAFTCAPESGGCQIVGFENHSGRTLLGSGVAPLGQVLQGYGNNGDDGTEGARYRNVFGTYCHGPILPKNPEFCDTLLRTALTRKYGRAELAPLDDTTEQQAHAAAMRLFAAGKK